MQPDTEAEFIGNPKSTKNAEKINWQAPVMSSREKAANFFQNLEHGMSESIAEIRDYKAELQRDGLWEDFLQYHELNEERQALQDKRNQFKLYPDQNEYEYEEMENLNRQYNAVSDEIIAWNSKNGEDYERVTRSYLYGWEDKKRDQAGQKLRRALDAYEAYKSNTNFDDSADIYVETAKSQEWKDYQAALIKFHTLNSPYFRYLVANSDQIDIDTLITQIKESYRVLTLDDHIETAERLIDECAKDNKLILFKDMAKQMNDHPNAEQAAAHLTSSDEFMIDLVTELAKKRGIETQVFRGEEGIFEFFESYTSEDPSRISEALDKLESGEIVVGMIDDAMYSGSQKAGVFLNFEKDARHSYAYQRTGYSREQWLQMNQAIGKSLRFYVAGSTQKAMEIFQQQGNFDRVYVHKHLPTVDESIQEPYLSYIRHFIFTFGEMATGIPESSKYRAETVIRREKQQRLAELATSKPLVVTPFKVPDWKSMAPIWYQTPDQKTSLFSLKESGSAYIPAESLLAGYSNN